MGPLPANRSPAYTDPSYHQPRAAWLLGPPPIFSISCRKDTLQSHSVFWDSNIHTHLYFIIFSKDILKALVCNFSVESSSSAVSQSHTWTSVLFSMYTYMSRCMYIFTRRQLRSSPHHLSVALCCTISAQIIKDKLRGSPWRLGVGGEIQPVLTLEIFSLKWCTAKMCNAVQYVI